MLSLRPATPHTRFPSTTRFRSGASDILIKANKPGYVRLGGKLKPVDMDPITSPEAEAFVAEHCPKIFLPKWEGDGQVDRSEEHTSELQSHHDLVCRLLLGAHD